MKAKSNANTQVGRAEGTDGSTMVLRTPGSGTDRATAVYASSILKGSRVLVPADDVRCNAG